MINNKILPAHILRLYTWELLDANTTMTKINGLVPVIPLGEEPQVADARAAYLVYGFAEQASGATKQIRRGSFSLRICARSFAQLGEIASVIQRAFESDWSAENVNRWSSDFGNDELVGIRFTDLDITYVEGGDAPTSEGGPWEGLVNIAYQYITQQSVKLYNGTDWS